MTRHEELSQWTECLSTTMPHLRKPQVPVLALWSFGIACTRSCGRGTVATFLALLLNQPLANLEQRLYEWCLDAKDKAGAKRTDLEVTTCFVPLLAWIVRLWTTSQIALTIDATSLSDRFVVLAICVVYRGCAIPVAWTILPAGQKRAWRREWLRMLRQLRGAIPPDWTVLVLADRGLYARGLFRRIVRLHWHPLLRINQAGKFRPYGQAQFVWPRDLVGTIGQRWRGHGTAFASKDCRLDCTPAGCFGGSHGCTGIRSCGSTKVANSVRTARRSLCGRAIWSGRAGSAGGDRARPLPRPTAGWSVRWWPGGATDMPSPGLC